MRTLIVAALALAVSACSCEEGTKKRAPILEVLDSSGGMDRTSVDFGFVQVSIKGVQKVRVRNSGNALLSISAVTTSSTLFGVDNTLPVDVEPGDETELLCTFTPAVADQRITGTMELTTNDSSHEKYTLQLAGQGVTAVARPTPTPIAFGDVYVGEMKTVMLTLTNAGGNALPVMGAAVMGAPPGVSGDFTALTNAMIAAGGSVAVPVTFAPTAMGVISGASVQISIDATYGGNVTVPITGRAAQALPRMCFKFDDTGVEQCTDQITTTLNIGFGALCDTRLYACAGSSGQRTGKLYLKNEGNVVVSYSAQYQPYVYTGSRCGDAGVPHSDFVFSNVSVPDGGVPSPLNVATTSLPSAETDPKPWETAPIDVLYRASSQCLTEGADQARVLWTRQGPTGRMPATLFATLTGTSLLPAAKPKPVNFGQAGTPFAVPHVTPSAVELVTNEGSSPLTLTSVEMWEEVPPYLLDGGLSPDGGGPEGGKLQQCNPGSSAYESSECARFHWAPGQAPVDLLPITLDGGATPTSPSQAVVGRLFVGCLADGGSCPPSITRYHVYAIVNTSDPYTPRVLVPIVAYVQYVP